MKHRHLTYAHGKAVEDLPAAAILDILDRGDLADWKPLAVAIGRDPHGTFAERVADLLEAHPMYGTTALWRAWITHVRQGSEAGRAIGERTTLAALRRNTGLTQAQLASRTGMSQSDLSKFERRDDVRVSTLKNYINGLGGCLHLLARIGDSTKEVDIARMNHRHTAGRRSSL